MKRIVIALAAIVLLVAGCATYRTYYVEQPVAVGYAEKFAGKTLAIKPVEIVFENSRGIITEYMMMGDSYLQRYAVQEDSMEFDCSVGILQPNVLRKVKLDTARYSAFATDALVKGAYGEVDYCKPYMKGLGNGNYGYVSNRPVAIDAAVYPTAITYLASAAKRSYFDGVMVIGRDSNAASADYRLEATIRLDNEIQEITGVPSGFEWKQGDYCLAVDVWVSFKIVDVRTGAVVVSENTPSDYATGFGGRQYFKLPIAKPADFYRLEKFLTLDYSGYPQAVVEQAMSGFYTYIAPFVVNAAYMEEVKEAK